MKYFIGGLIMGHRSLKIQSKMICLPVIYNDILFQCYLMKNKKCEFFGTDYALVFPLQHNLKRNKKVFITKNCFYFTVCNAKEEYTSQLFDWA